jgi:hypothetical protein
MGIRVKLRSEEKPRKVDGHRAEEQQATWLVLFDGNEKVIGRIRLDDVEGWWNESEASSEPEPAF